ncbi:MAG: sensor histidine kinase, partial [Sphingomonadales bacterium]
MAFKQRFVAGLAWRIALLLLAVFAFVSALRIEGLAAARLLAGLACLATIAGLWRYVQRTNVELARFVEAIRFGDFSQSFSERGEGSGFAEMGEALEQGMQRLREERRRLTDANRFYEAVLDDAPIAVLTVDADGRVELANKAARRLFARHSGVRIEDFATYGSSFAKSLSDTSASGPRLVPLVIDAMPQAAMVSSATVHRLGGVVHAVAVQPIQSELNAVELAAQSDLVRVLTHEVMNSMTPVTSLAHTAAELMGRVDASADPAIADARAAVETLARRADGVMHFVQSYRQISRSPQVRRRMFPALGWAREIEALFRASEPAEGVRFTLSVEPEDLQIGADPDLLSQVLINLLRNAAEAAVGHSDAPTVSLSFAPTRGGRTRI